MNNKIETSLTILGIRPFRVESCYALDNAQRNLSGRSHYADKETLRYFKARILDAYTAKENLVFWLIESNNSKHFEPKKNKRFICFDIFGTVLNERDDWFSTSKAADNARRCEMVWRVRKYRKNAMAGRLEQRRERFGLSPHSCGWD